MLTDVIAAINADFAAQTPTPIPVVCTIGPQGLAENNDFPRVVILFTKDKFGPKNTQTSAGINPSAIRTRHAGCEVHVWGETYDQTALLAHLFIVSLYRVARGVFTLGEGNWNNKITVENRGFEFVFGFTAEIPIQETPWPLTPPTTTFTGDVAAEFPDSQVSGNVPITVPIP